MRFAAAIGVSVCFAVFAWGVTAAEREADIGWWRFTKAPLLFAVVAALPLCAGVAAFRLCRGAPSRRRAWPAFASAAAVALLAATPVSFFYDDGCNDHWTTSPAAAAPFIAVTRPDNSRASYNDMSTLALCSRTPLRLPLRDP